MKFELEHGVFMLTLDTELAWGTRGRRDLLPDYQQTREIIRRLLELCVRYQIKATWAVVGHLFLDRCDGKHAEVVAPRADWFAVDPGTDQLRDPIWYGKDIIEMIRACPVPQEIGSHTFSHIDLEDPACTEFCFSSELDACQHLASEHGLALTSFVYPRNHIHHLETLRRHGFTCFRGLNAQWFERLPRVLRRIGHIIDEYLCLPAPTVRPSCEQKMTNVPGSYFYVHRRGWARYVPIAFRVWKTKHGIAKAIKRKQTFHLWFHPFNLASDPDGLLGGIEEIFQEVAKQREVGVLDNVTMAEAASKTFNTPAAIVLDGQLQSALACVRLLGKRGVRVIVGAERSTALARHSRSCSSSFTYASPMDDRQKFLEDLEHIIDAEPVPPAIFCFSDLTLLPIAEQRERILAKARLPLADASSIDIAFDKAKTIELALSLDVSIPKTTVPADDQEALDVFNASPGPFVIKPRHSCVWKNGKGVWGKALFPKDGDDAFVNFVETYERTGEYPLVQERIVGGEYGIFALYDHGKRLASFAHHRLRSLDPSGGASSLRESIALPDDMAGHAWKLLDALGWHGPAMVEFKRDERDGLPKLMEINGRFWGSLPLAIFAGVDFPWMAYQQAIGQTVEASGSYRKNIRARHLLADVQGLIRSKQWRGFFRFSEPGLYYDVESCEDPWPFVFEIFDVLARKVK